MTESSKGPSLNQLNIYIYEDILFSNNPNYGLKVHVNFVSIFIIHQALDKRPAY